MANPLVIMGSCEIRKVNGDIFLPQFGKKTIVKFLDSGHAKHSILVALTNGIIHIPIGTIYGSIVS